MDIDRFVDEDLFRGEKAHDLLNQPVFQYAVRSILNDHAAMEEDLVCSQADIRDATARIREHAQMRRAIIEVVNELNRIVQHAENMKYEQFGD